MIGNLHEVLPPAAATVALTFVAALCGAAVGAERERHFKPAGLRTMMLIAVGSAVFMMLSLAVETPGESSPRIAAQIVTGIGFLGAGAILHGGGGVRGLTTAATIWVMAAVGMTVGAGYAAAGVALAATVVGVLVGAAAIERRYLGPCEFRRVVVVLDTADGKGAVRVHAVLDDYRIPSASRHERAVGHGRAELTVTYCNAHKHHREFLRSLADVDDVRSLETAR